MQQKPRPKQKSKLKKYLALLGPGFITGAADDDPSGIVTYTQAGAQFGLGQLWTMFLTLPMMVAIQEICGRIGIVTGKGLSSIIKENYSRAVLYIMVALLLVANTINLGTDLGAMSDVMRLYIKAPFIVFAAIFFVMILSLEILLPYHKYARILKYLTFCLFAYFITGFLVAGNWHELLGATFWPQIKLTPAFVYMIVGVVGTTISPYLFFWQTSQEVEEQQDWILKNHHMPKKTGHYIANMRTDTVIGMIFSNLTAWFIIVTAYEVLNKHGLTDIQTAAQAAQALEPLVKTFPYAGTIAQLLFGIGVIGTGLLAIPIFAAASSYAISEIMNWRAGLNYKFNQAKGFYWVIVAGTLIGLLFNFFGINPIKALIYTAVINGIISVPMIYMILHVSNSPKIMGKYVNGFWTNFFGFLAFAGILAASAYTIFNLFVK